VADGGGLENRYGVTPIVGSNPTPSALSCRSVLKGLRWPLPDGRGGLSCPQCARSARKRARRKASSLGDLGVAAVGTALTIAGYTAVW
jgi:hypothetical protein